MLEDPQSDSGTTGEAPSAESGAAPAKKAAAKKTAAKKATAKRTTAKKAAAPAAPPPEGETAAEAAPAKKAAAKKTAKKATAKKTTAKRTTAKKAAAEPPAEPVADAPAEGPAASAPVPLFQAPETTTTVTRRTRKSAASAKAARTDETTGEGAGETTDAPPAGAGGPGDSVESAPAAKKTSGRRPAAKKTAAPAKDAPQDDRADEAGDDRTSDDDQDGDESGEGGSRRRRRRGGRRRRKSGEGGDADAGEDNEQQESGSGRSSGQGGQGGKGSQGSQGSKDDADSDEGGEGTSRRRRRRRRTGDDGDEGSDDPQNTVTRVRKTRSAEDQITAVSGSTRLEAKKQRRREGREAGRRRAPIVSEAEFLARRESVDRVMVIRQRDELTQIGVLEDKVLVEHYVARESQTSLIGNVYLGRVQNVLPSMEAAFVDIGKGRNAVLYAGEVNWSALGHKDGQPRKIESVLSSGQSILVQVTKDPIGHKGARLTSQISLAGRFLVYVPDGTTSGISRKLPDTERNRLKTLLKEIVPDSAGVIVRTAAEGASEDELTRDVERLKARWEDIEKKSKGNAPQLLYGEPDLTLKVVRDLFTEDFGRLVIQGQDAWDTVQNYVSHVAPDLEERLERYEPDDHHGKDIFAEYRVEEQIAKALDRKVFLPSGGSLIIDRTEAMTVIDVNTGKFTGSGGNLEETVTKNNLEAAEEVVRQLRLRDIGGIIVVDFIDMVLESNRDLVLRRLVECLGRDRTRHQVAEVTSLGLVQMTRKRIGTGLIESFSENCEHCQGRGVVIHDAPVEPRRSDDDSRRGGRRTRGGRGRDDDGGSNAGSGGNGGGGGNGSGKPPSPKDIAAMARQEKDEKDEKAAQAASAQDEPETRGEEKSESRGEQPDAAQDQPKVTSRSRSRGGRGQSRDRTPEAATEVPAEAPAVESTPAESRPAPVAEAPPAPEPEAAPEAAPEPPAEKAAPEPPKVVTRTRRRSASRPAGPPAASPAAGSGAIGEPPTDGTVEPGTALTEPGGADGPVVEHVPIKKRGSRKR